MLPHSSPVPASPGPRARRCARPAAAAAAAAALAIAAAACSRPAVIVATPPAPAPANSVVVHPSPTVSAPTTRDTIDVVVAATTDVHGRLRGWDYYANAPDAQRGLSRAATIVDSLRTAYPQRVVLVDAGDLLQGNPLTYVAARVAADSLRPHPVAAAMSAMQYDAAAIGNHEFNYGLPTLERAIGDATFPLLAANAYRPDGTRAFKAWTMVERGGAQIALIGATTPGSNLWDRDNLAGKLTIGDIVPAVRAGVAEARAAGADAIVVLLHSGLDEPSSYDTVATHVASENVAARVAREIPGIDLVVFGHSHKELADSVIGTTHLLQPKNWASSVGVAHLALVRAAVGWRVAAVRSSLVPAAGHAEAPRVLAATDAAHRATVAYATTPIGVTPVAWRADSARVVDTPLIDFILEVERRATGAQLASTAAFSTDASLAAGPITVARLAALYPYDNTLRKIRISGRALRAYLEHSARYYRLDAPGRVSVDPAVPGYNFDIVAGVDYTIDLSRPVGSRVTRLRFAGRNVAPTDSFTLALNNYRQTGGGGYAMLAGSRNLDDRQLEIRQLLIDEVRARKTIRPEDYFHRNWEIVPATAVAQAYASMRRIPGEGASARTPAASGSAARAPEATTSTGIAPAGTRLRVIATNDVHGALEPRTDSAGVARGGMAQLAGAIARARRECVAPCASILLDAGDEMQGTPASNLAFGRPMIAIFDTLGLAAAALGNHEFDWGQDTLRARMRQAHYAFLGANVRDSAGRDVSWIRNDTIVRVGGLRVGIIGVSTRETPTSTLAVNVRGLRFDDPAPIVDSIAAALRARGADAVIVVAHAGAFCDRTGATQCAGEIVTMAQQLHQRVDLIVSGHTHSLVNTVVNGIPIVQARSRSTALDVVDLALDNRGALQHEVRDILSDSLAADPKVARIVAGAVGAVAARVDRPVARIAEYLRKSPSGTEEETPLGNLIADAMRVVGRGDVAVMNNGGIRAPLNAGVATYGALFEVEPFGNVLYRVHVRGADLRAYLERLVGKRRPTVHLSGVVVAYDTTRAPGSRIASVRFTDGSSLDDAATYVVVLNDFEYTNGSGLGFGDRATAAEPTNIVDLDAFVQYLETLPQPVAAPRDQRFVVVGGQ